MELNELDDMWERPFVTMSKMSANSVESLQLVPRKFMTVKEL